MSIRKTLRIGITTGDVGGIGPELIIRGLQDPKFREMFTPIIYGPGRALNIYRKVLSIDKFSYNVIQEPSQAHPKKVSVIDPGIRFDRVDIGRQTEFGGEAAVAALDRAVEDLKSGEIDALVTMPIDKSTVQSEKFNFPGHTEFLAQSFSQTDSLMLMVSEKVRVAVVTGHIPIQKVSEQLTVEKVYDKLKMLDESLRVDFNCEKPRIAVLGLNPHAGDGGLLGTEDDEIIAKAIEKFKKKNGLVIGPYPADGLFGSGKFMSFDGVLAMYHDQGLIPFKLIAGYQGVNFTAGLPGVRTSPDHGVAYDLAGQNRASLDSFQQAVFAAMDIFRTRSENRDLIEGAMEMKDLGSRRPPRKSSRGKGGKQDRGRGDGGRGEQGSKKEAEGKEAPVPVKKSGSEEEE